MSFAIQTNVVSPRFAAIKSPATKSKWALPPVPRPTKLIGVALVSIGLATGYRFGGPIVDTFTRPFKQPDYEYRVPARRAKQSWSSWAAEKLINTITGNKKEL